MEKIVNVNAAAFICFVMMLGACDEGPVELPGGEPLAGALAPRIDKASGARGAGHHAGSGGSLTPPARPDAGAEVDDAGEPAAVLCGNGRLEPNEACDDSVRGKRCPAAANDCAQTRDSCWSWRVAGTGCQRTCVHDQPHCGVIVDPREPFGLSRICTEGCPVAAADPWS